MRVSEVIEALQKAPPDANVVVYFHYKHTGFVKDVNHVGSKVMDDTVFIGVDELTPIQRDDLLKLKEKLEDANEGQ